MSWHTILPWEDFEEYRGLHEALIAEYAPCGPTEGHFVEAIAGIMRRKQRLRMAEAGATRDSLSLLATEYRQSQKTSFIDLDIFNGEKKKAIDENALSLVAIPPHEMKAKLKKIEDQLKKSRELDRENLERRRDFLTRYREMHEAAQSNIAAGPNFEKFARYETNLDRKFELRSTYAIAHARTGK